MNGPGRIVTHSVAGNDSDMTGGLIPQEPFLAAPLPAWFSLDGFETTTWIFHMGTIPLES